MKTKNNSENRVQSIDRALSILEHIVNAENGLTITELGNTLGLPKSTIHRLITTLVLRGYVKNGTHDHKYRPGLKLFEMGSMVLNSLELRKEVHPFLEELMEKTGETIHLGVLDECEVVYIDKVESPHTIRMYSKIGKKAPLHCTGLGKAILAYSPFDVLDKVVKEKGLTAYTENSITDITVLKTHLDQIKKQGYSIDNSEHEREIKCVAGPIFDYTNHLLAAFSISIPVMRLTDEKFSYFIQLVLTYSEKISKALGYVGKHREY